MFDTSTFRKRLRLALLAFVALVCLGVALALLASNRGGLYATRANVAIRQKALGSDIQFLFHASAVEGAKVDSIRTAIRDLLARWDKTQRDLITGTELYGHSASNSEEVNRLLFEANEPLTRMRDSIEHWIALESPPDLAQLSILDQAFGQYTVIMDSVVNQWMDEETLGKRLLTILSLALVVLTWLVFAIMLRFVIRPGVRKMEEAAQEIRRVELDLQEANRVKTEFMANMSHEIRTPLNGVIGMTEVLSSTGLTADQREYVRSIQSSATNLLDLVNDILDYSQLEAGKMEVHRERFILSDCMDQVADIMKPLANQKKLELITDVDPDLPIEIVQDERRIRQIILNLVNNAVKFTDHGEVVMKVNLLSRDKDFVHIKFSIEDTGIGIEPDKLPLLFRSFSQADGSVSRKYGGSGLGLAICKSLVNELGGKIWVESTPGKGSVFYFTIVAETSAESRSSRIKGLNGLKALVVDDNKTNLKILVRQLSNWGIQATPFNSPDLVMEIIPDLRKFDFCILDMQMPEMDGAALAGRMREYHGIDHFPIIVLSSVGRHLVDARGDLYNAYLTKPVRQSRLLDTIAEVMKRSKPEPSVLAVGGRFEGRFNQSRLKVLIAHDNELTRAVTEKTLQLLGYPFEVAHSGEELLEQSRRDHYDLIIMDADMPNVSGVETVRRMRRIKSDEDMPVVIGILSTDGIERQACLKAGMDDVMTRPLRTEDLQRKILYWMEDATG